MRTSGIVLLLLIVVGLGNQAAGTMGETCENASDGACGQTCCDCCGCHVQLSPKDLPTGVRSQEGDEDLLVCRGEGILHFAARVPPRLRRLLPAAAPLWKAEMREEAGQEGVPG